MGHIPLLHLRPQSERPWIDTCSECANDLLPAGFSQGTPRETAVLAATVGRVYSHSVDRVAQFGSRRGRRPGDVSTHCVVAVAVAETHLCDCGCGTAGL